jgi:hypothetical protein
MESSATHRHGWRFWLFVGLGVWLAITGALVLLAVL